MSKHSLGSWYSQNPLPIGFWNGKETAYFEHELVDGLLPTGDCTIPLYIDPPARKPLTDEEIDAEFDRECWVTVVFADGARGIALDKVTARDFARSIERAHGIGVKHE